VDGVSFELEPHRTLALIGESGSGKTMTALSVLRLISPPAAITGGRVLYRGQDIVSLSAEAIRQLRGKRLAMIFQNPRDRFDPLRTMSSQLVEVLLYHHVCKTRRDANERALTLLEEVQVAQAQRVLRMYPNELSGGMLQRVLIAIAVAASPDVLIADEPTSALDVTIQAEILDLLLELQRSRGMSMLFITHDIGVAQQVADAVAVMYAGQIVEQGAASDVLVEPRHPYTQALLAAVPKSGADRLTPIPSASAGGRPEGCRFAPRCVRASEHGKASIPPPFFQAGPVAVRCWLYAGPNS
jgi:oligopeptide/dipeptide ABC transporter ATP-binding protein